MVAYCDDLTWSAKGCPTRHRNCDSQFADPSPAKSRF